MILCLDMSWRLRGFWTAEECAKAVLHRDSTPAQLQIEVYVRNAQCMAVGRVYMCVLFCGPRDADAAAHHGVTSVAAEGRIVRSM